MHDADDEATRLSRKAAPTTDAATDDATVLKPRAAPVPRDASANASGAAVPFAVSGSSDLIIGDVVRDRFVIESILGRGGMGVVYRARDLRKEEMQDSDPYVALKVLGGDFSRDPRMMMALQREARKAQSLAHPNIATVYDFDRDGDRVYITMEVLDGQPLNKVIQDHPGGLPRQKALGIIRGLCLGLAYAHNKGIVHSDFKPGNAFLTSDDRTRILDFGIARAAPAGTFGSKASSAKASSAQASTTTLFDAAELGALTPAYASCEMFDGLDPHPADDVFALAIVAYQLFSGRHPFDFTPATEARRRGLEPAPIKGLKRREWRALRRGLAFERAARSQHAAEFLRDIEGSPRLRLAAAVVITALLASAAYATYDWYAARLAEMPEIAFEDLPGETQNELTTILSDGDTFDRFGDAASALDRYLAAYRLHPRNPDALARIEGLVQRLTDQASHDPRDAQVLRANLEAVMATDEFLGKRRSLVDALARLQEAAASR